MCICILLSYQVCCFVTNVVKIIPSSNVSSSALSALSLHGRETGKGRIHTVCICILLSYQRVKEESSRQLMSVWLFHIKKTQRRLHRLHMLNVKLSDKQNKSVLSLALAPVYRPPGPYTDFLKEFADFLSDLLVTVDKALIVGDFNIHVDNTNDALGLAFTDLINSFGVKQNVTGPTHRFNHTLDLIISHGIDLTDIDIIPQSDDVTDHFLVSCMLHITDINYMAPRYRPGRIIIPATKYRFTNNLPDLSQLLCVPINTDELDTITSNMGTIFSNMLETVAPIKLKKVREKRAAPWYNSYTHSLKKETRILERKWRKSNLEVFRIAWKNSMSSYRQALKTARTEYIRKLIDNHQNNPRFLFSTVARLTNKQMSPDLNIPSQFNSNDFMNFFTDKIDNIRNTITNVDSTASSTSASFIAPKEKLQCFRTIGQDELNKLITASKPTTCLLDPVPTKLLKELLPVAEELLLNIINSSLSLGHVPKPFKLAVIKPLIKKPKLDPCELANYRPISNLPFMSKILEKVVSAQLCSFLQKNQIKIKSLLLSHHQSTSALVSEILMSVLQTVQKKTTDNLHMDRQCKKKQQTIYIWTVHIYGLCRRQCAKYTYIYSVHIVYYKDILNYQRHIIHRMGTSTLCTVSIHNVVYA